MRWIRALVVLALIEATVAIVLAVGATMALPSYQLEVAFGIDPRVEPAGGDWVDISQWLEEGSVSRGQSSELERFQAGTLDVLLDNEDRRFEPDYKESPYYPNVELDQHIRLRAVQGATTYDIYRGFVSDWDPEWRLPNKARVTAIDAFRYFNSKQMPSPYETEVMADSPTAYYRFAEESGDVALDRSDHARNGSYVGDVQKSTSLVHDSSDKALRLSGEQYALLPATASPNGTEAFWMEMSFQLDESSLTGTTGVGTGAGFNILKAPSGLTYADPQVWSVIWVDAFNGTTGTQGYLRFLFNDGLLIFAVGLATDAQPHHLILSKTSGGNTVSAWVDGVSKTVYDFSGSGSAIDLGVVGGIFVGRGRRVTNDGSFAPDEDSWWRGPLDEVVIKRGATLSGARAAVHYAAASNPWGDEASGARINRALDSISWPAGLRNVDTGDSVLQMASDVTGEGVLEHMQRVEASEFGGFYMTGAGKARFRERSALSSTAQVTIGRDVGQLPYVEIKPDRNENQLRNEIRFTRVGGLEQVASTSNRFFARTFSRNDLMNTTDDEVRTLAVAVRDRYQVPLTDYTVLLNPRADDALWAEVFGRELEDAVMVSRIPPLASTSNQFIWNTSEWDEDTRWGSAISKAMRILGIKHDFGKGFSWKTTWKLSPV